MLGEHLHLEIRKRMRTKEEKKCRAEAAEEPRKCCIVLYCENHGSQNCEEIFQETKLIHPMGSFMSTKAGFLI